MKKSKPILVIAGTLLIGFILGFFVSQYITNHKIKKTMQWLDNDVFVSRIYDRIDATEEEKEQLYPILQEYSEKITGCFDTQKAIIDSMRIELNHYLTPEKMKKLDKCFECTGRETCYKKNNHKME